MGFDEPGELGFGVGAVLGVEDAADVGGDLLLEILGGDLGLGVLLEVELASPPAATFTIRIPPATRSTVRMSMWIQMTKEWVSARPFTKPAGHAEVAAELTPEEDVQKVVDGEIRDNVLSFQLREEFVVRGILRNYITDPVSLNHATLIEWLNPDYVETEASSKVRIACVQYQVRKIDSFEDFANQVEYFVETAADYHSDFVRFPEFFTVQWLSIHRADVRLLPEIRSLHHRRQPPDRGGRQAV